ncbi:MAG: TonB-dependent receptor [candidate division WOR-3 bacterium]|nr:MAG: TonB-dependent receptor [candidate division WOR-3 bacterium]
MLRFLLVAFAAVVAAGPALASQTGKILGRVTDRSTGQALPQASVIVDGGEYGAATDVNGYYAILNVPVGMHAIEASMVGYRTIEVTEVKVESDRSVRQDFRLEETAIEMPKVVVKAEKPMVSKEMVASRYAVQKEQIAYLPGDRLSEVMVFTPGVARTESSYHVRGGRAHEVDYLIDGVSVVDPLTGEFGIELSKGVADEVIFMPGGFSAEYGRAMSGVINLITVNPRQKLGAGYRVKSEEPMPFYYDFGYTDHGLQLHLPVNNDFRTVVNAGVTTTEDWDPRLWYLPHKNRQDYSLYGKAFYNAGGKLKFDLSGVASRTQYDRYKSEWKLLLDDYRSDMRHGQLGIGRATYMPNSRSVYSLALALFHTDKTFGVRRPGGVDFWEDFEFRDTSEYRLPARNGWNPWEIYSDRFADFFFTNGTYQEWRRTDVSDWNLRLTANNQVTSNHQLTLGGQADLYDVASDRVAWPSTNSPVIDVYHHTPVFVGAFVQDKIDYEGLYANVGVRLDHFRPDADYKVDPTDRRPGAERREATPKSQVSPRVGASFRITEWLFARANIGYYFQMPLLSVLYDNSLYPVVYRTSYGDSLLVVGNPDLNPERTQSYELGLQGEVAKGLMLSLNVWRKDVYDLIGTREVPAQPQGYVTYFNIDYARLTGVEFVVDVRNHWFGTKLSYTLSDARGTSSYANEAFYEFIQQGDTAPAKEYPLDFNQPHRFFFQVDMEAPEDISGWRPADLVLDNSALHLLAYLGRGFPYTPPGGKNDPLTWNTTYSPWRSNVDAVLTKGFSFAGLNLDLVVEVLNVLHVRDILYVYPATGLPNDDGAYPPYIDFEYIRDDPSVTPMWIGYPWYDAERDMDHDGYVTGEEAQASEHYRAREYHKASIDWVNNYGPPRRARLGIEIGW